MVFLATMVNSRKMLTTAEERSTLDVPGRGAYIRHVNWVMYSGGGTYIQGVLMYRGHINGILQDFHLESNYFFKTVQ